MLSKEKSIMEPCLIALSVISLTSVSLTRGQEVTVVSGTATQVFTTALYWDYDNEVLLYVDKYYYEIRRLNISTGEDEYITLDYPPSFVIPTNDYNRRFIIGKGTNIEYLFWPYDYPGGYYAECLIATVDYYCPGNNLNDGRADAYGRVWTSSNPAIDSNGSYAYNQGTLYSFDTRVPGKAGVSPILRPVTFGNDLTWTRDNNIFYFVESNSTCIFSYNYDLVSGLICCGRAVFCLADFNITGNPDGIAIDWNDNLWIAGRGSGLVLNINPNTGELLTTVDIPAKYVTDVEFGGPDLDILFVATEDVGDPTDIGAGSIYQVKDLGVYGQPENYAVMNSDCTPEFFD